MLTYPEIDPVIFSILGLKIRWYGMMYVFGFLAGWWLARRRSRQPWSTISSQQVDDLVFYVMLGVIVGGRLGYILFYGWVNMAEDPLYIVKIWQGGMSFHGGLAGVVAPLVPLGLGFGRIGNFINGELWGKPTDVPWAFNVPDEVFAGFRVGDEVLHATMLYEAALEGLVLFGVLLWFSSKERPYMAVSGLFLLLYGLFRFYIEFYRVPDAHIGYLFADWVTMGQLLSTPMIIAGAILLYLAYRPTTKREATT
jgi:phosphatidylglycerol:prolipoprotein diacylglycerol transferase